MSQTPFDIQRAAVVGAGTMGRGIVMCLANAGVAVQWVDNNPQMLEQALVAVAETYAHGVRQGRIDQGEADARIARVTRADDYAAIRNVDLVIEAVYENLELKQKIFRELDGLLKPEAILASNTSALDIDAIAAVTRRPAQVLGLHFFSPAHIMKLLEIVRGAHTSTAVLDAALVLGKRMGKVSVVSGNCHGFIGNRMLHPYVLEARKMLLEGAFPIRWMPRCKALVSPWDRFVCTTSLASIWSGAPVSWRARAGCARGAGGQPFVRTGTVRPEKRQWVLSLRAGQSTGRA